MKTLKWFSLEWDDINNKVGIWYANYNNYRFFPTEHEAFTWLENNGYIERIKG